MKELHIPVLLSEVLASLKPQRGESYLDLTAGYGGHAKAILDVTQNYKDTVLVDRDEFAVNYLKRKFHDITIMQTDFCNAMSQLLTCGKTFDIILMDFGVSSPQLDREERGFSYAKDGPLDMRMDRSQTLSAEQIVNHWSPKQLTDIFVKYGELSPKRARMLAMTIVENRPIKGTKQLAELIISKSYSSRKHPATQIFQAIRIAVNDELGEIERALPMIPDLLNPGGRVAFITFHSLEDRLVKRFLKEATSRGEESLLKLVNKKPIEAEPMELVINLRARSAKLRVAERN